MYLLQEVLRRNAAKKFHACRNINEGAEKYEAFVEILCSEELATEEKKDTSECEWLLLQDVNKEC